VNDAPALKQAEVGVAVSNATDVAKGAASCVLTVEGLSAMIPLVQVGRQIHQRIVTWILNKIAKTLQQGVFIIVMYLIQGEFIIDDGKLLLLLFLIDFVTVSLSTDNVKWSKKPSKWNIKKLCIIGATVGVLVTAQSFGILYLMQNHLLPPGPMSERSLEKVKTFTFNVLFFEGMSTIISVRQESWFFKSFPSITLAASFILDAAVVILLSVLGYYSLDPSGNPSGFSVFIYPIPITWVLLTIGWALVWTCAVNDPIKILLYKILNRYMDDGKASSALKRVKTKE